ncbi:MAG: class II fumarate hydratase [Victivallales bacterium]|nr:class II fumarate hydratase [Victivallales bacterium]MCF7888577.1 class II fumarate hydratase [Victivallales bacterium]
MKSRQERDSIGIVNVPYDKYWGAQTQRSLKHFSIGEDKMPKEVINALAVIKKASANTNYDFNKISENKCSLICRAADEIIEGKLDIHFPLHVWQTGSGTQSNMNVNEVIANRANEISHSEKIALEKPVHPNNDVNMSQSSNDTFSAAMHISAVKLITDKLVPSVLELKKEIAEKAEEFNEIIKVGRTHLQDAVPLRLGQEFSGYCAQLEDAVENIENTYNGLLKLALGGTAVGTGLNCPSGFPEKVAKRVSVETGIAFKTAPNKFAYIAAHDSLINSSGSIKVLACALMKIANDIRWLGSGPRCGIGELILPENEPGSSIMPGKVNPTQCEAMTMAAVQVMGYDSAIGIAGSQGNFELNVFKPLMIFNLLQEIKLISDACDSFRKYLIKGLKANKQKIEEYLENSLMQVTALNELIGYEKASEIAKKAYSEHLTLKNAALKLGYLSSEEFDKNIKPENMV